MDSQGPIQPNAGKWGGTAIPSSEQPGASPPQPTPSPPPSAAVPPADQPINTGPSPPPAAQPEPPAASKSKDTSSTAREKQNWRIHLLYVRHDFDGCLKVIDQQIDETNGRCEYALYVKALIKRHQGEIEESLHLFQAVTAMNPKNINNLKQVARSLFLFGKHKAAMEVYNEAQKIDKEDWAIWYNKGMCYQMMGDLDKAMKCFLRSNSIQRHDVTFKALGKVYMMQGDDETALEVFSEALEFSPDNPELLTTLGLLSLRVGDATRAFTYLGNALTFDPKNPKSILGAGSIIQDSGDAEVALIKYRIAAVHDPNSGYLWNNIGLCFFSKRKFVAAIACFKRALYLLPFEWIISYNLGLVHLVTAQHASAFHFFSSAVNINPEFASAYMYLGVTLSRLNDLDNAFAAYVKAIELDPTNLLFPLNYAVTLLNSDNKDKARDMFGQFQTLFDQLDPSLHSDLDPDVLQQRDILGTLLK